MQNAITANQAAGNGNVVDALIQALTSLNGLTPSPPLTPLASPEEPLWAYKKRHGIPADEHECAEAIGFSVHWIRKDRRGRQIVPFFLVGSAVRYDINKALESITALERGGDHLRPRTRRTKTQN